MKKTLLVALLISVALISCSEKKEPDTDHVVIEETASVDSATVVASTPLSAEAEGLQLIEGADCLACHKMDAKLVGPSYHDVAKKYTEADLDMLAQKIIDGGKGTWGDVPMTPHTGMSKENAQKMAKYILSLEKK